MPGTTRASGAGISAIPTVSSVTTQSSVETIGDGCRERNGSTDLHLDDECTIISAVSANAAEAPDAPRATRSATAAVALRRIVLATVPATARSTVAAALAALSSSAFASLSSAPTPAAMQIIGDGAGIALRADCVRGAVSAVWAIAAHPPRTARKTGDEPGNTGSARRWRCVTIPVALSSKSRSSGGRLTEIALGGALSALRSRARVVGAGAIYWHCFASQRVVYVAVVSTPPATVGFGGIIS